LEVPRRTKCKVFVSYSRHDEALVRPLAGLLGAAANDAVFLDVSSIRPGDKWKSEINAALDEASVFIVCWCCASAVSEMVGYEVKKALRDENKRLVPVRFCDEPLPLSLGGHQWTDLRGRIVHTCRKECIERQHARSERSRGTLLSPTEDDPSGSWDLAELTAINSPSPVRRSRTMAIATGLALSIAAVAFISLMLVRSIEFQNMPDSPPPSWSEPVLPALLLLLFIVAASTAAVGLFAAIRRTLQRRTTDRLATTAISYFEGIGKAR
jgi:TIR domain-containing protein